MKNEKIKRMSKEDSRTDRILLRVFLMLRLLPDRLVISPPRTSFSEKYKQRRKMLIREEAYSLGRIFKSYMQSNSSMGGLVGFLL